MNDQDEGDFSSRPISQKTVGKELGKKDGVAEAATLQELLELKKTSAGLCPRHCSMKKEATQEQTAARIHESDPGGSEEKSKTEESQMWNCS